MIIGLDADTGYVSQMDTICSATDYQADQLTGPTDPFLDGSWTCECRRWNTTARRGVDEQGGHE